MAADSVGQIGLDLVVNDKSFKQQMAGIQGLAKKAGFALAAAFSVKKIIDFGAQCIELGSDLAEVQNVVDVTFPRMSRQVDEFARNAAGSFGLSETMAKRFTGTFGSMAKAFGFNEKAAFEMSTALTGLAGDVASFYNISQDEAYTKLKSVFTGETESLKDLGIVMTQSALDSYALANGFGKTTAKMTEAEKVALRYRFVTEQLSLASGDFIRTSDGWANQVRILQLQFSSLKATIGQGLINVLTPVLKVINLIINKLMSLANAFRSFTEMITGKKGGGGASAATAGMEAMADSADQAGAAATGAGGAAKKAAKDMKGASTGIDELNIIQTPENGGSGSGGGAGGGYAADEFDMGEVDTSAIDEMDNKYQGLIDKARELSRFFLGGFHIAFGDQGVLDSIQQSISDIGQSFKEIFTNPAVISAADNFLNSLVFNLGRVAGGMASVGTSIADNLLGGISKFLEQNSQKIKDYLVSVFNIGADIANNVGRVSEAWGTVFEAFRSDSAKQLTADLIGIFSEVFMGLTELIGKFGADVLDLITAPFIQNKDLIKQTLENTFGTVEPVFSEIKAIVDECFDGLKKTYDESVGPMIHSFKEGFTEIVTKLLEAYNQHILPVLEGLSQKFQEFHSQYLSPLIDKFLEFSGKATDAVTEMWEDCLQPFILWFIDNISPVIAKHIQKVIDVFYLVASAVSIVVSAIFDSLGGLIDFIMGVFTGDWERAWSGVRTYLSTAWEMMKSLVKLAINFIADAIGVKLSDIKRKWDSIWSSVKAFADAVWNSIKESAGIIFTAIKNTLSEIWNSISQTIEAKWNKIKSWISAVWFAIKLLAADTFNAVKDKLSEIWDSIRQTIEEKWNAIKDWFGEIWQKIKAVFRLDEMLDIGKNVMNKLWDGMKSVWEDITGWLGGVADAVGEAWDRVVNGAKNLFKRGKEEAEEEAEEEDDEESDNSGPGGNSGYVNSGPGVKGHASGGFPKSGQMFVANENGRPEMVGSWGGKAAVASNMQITEGITRAVQSGMRSCLTPLVSMMSQMAGSATPPLAMVGSMVPAYSQEDKMREMVDKAVAMVSRQDSMSEQYLAVMVDLLQKIIDLIENLDLTVNVDIREIKKKLVDLEKRSGYTLKPT